MPRPSLRPRSDFSLSESTSKLTLTPVTPSSARTASATPVWKCPRIGQPAVVSETVTSTTPLACISTDRTISSSTMSRRSSGSITARRASITCSLVGMDLIVADPISRARPPASPRPRRLKDRRGATCVTPRRLREERVLHSPARYEAGEPLPRAALSWSPAGEVCVLRADPSVLRFADQLLDARGQAADCFSRSLRTDRTSRSSWRRFCLTVFSTLLRRWRRSRSKRVRVLRTCRSKRLRAVAPRRS